MKIIAVTSGKGGTGKSCVAAYTGMALADMGRRVLLLELGLHFRSLDLICGMQNSVALDVEDVMVRGCEPEDAMVTCEGHGGKLSLLTAGISGGGWTAAQVERLMTKLQGSFDFVIVDGADTHVLTSGLFDQILVVLTPDSLCVRATAHHTRELYTRGAQALRLVINNVPPRVLPMYGAEDFDDVIDMVGARLIGVIPASPKLQYSANNAQPLDQESLTVQVFENIAARLVGEDRQLLIT